LRLDSDTEDLTVWPFKQPLDLSLPLGDLSLERDYSLTVADPEDVADVLIKDNDELSEFYELTLGYPVADELRVAKKILQIKSCLAEPGSVAGETLADMFNVVREWEDSDLTADPLLAVAQLAEVVKELKESYPILRKVVAADTEPGEEKGPFDDEDDAWEYAFRDIEEIRKLLTNKHAQDLPTVRGRFGSWVERTTARRNIPWADTKRIIRNLSSSWIYGSGDDCEQLLERLRVRIRQTIAEARGNWKDVCRFHSCLQEAVRYRYRLVHTKASSPMALEWEVDRAQQCLALRVNAPWLTRYVLTTILDRRIVDARAGLPVIKRRMFVHLGWFLLLTLGSYFLFVSGFAWIGWLVLAYMLWRGSQEWMILKLLRAVGVRCAVLESVREEVVSGCYDPDEISRRLHRKELTIAVPSLVYPLLRLARTPRTSGRT
jgi:hypothetical protein